MGWAGVNNEYNLSVRENFVKGAEIYGAVTTFWALIKPEPTKVGSKGKR